MHNSKFIDFSLFEDVLKIQKPDGRTKWLGASNIDFSTEVDGRFLFIDWLDDEVRDEPWKTEGKLIYAKKLTSISTDIEYVFLTGDVERQEPSHLTVVRNGLLSLRSDDRSKLDWQPCNKEKLIHLVKVWVSKH